MDSDSDNQKVEVIQQNKYNELLYCRNVLWIMSFTGMAMNVAIANNISIAIVDMVKHKTIQSEFYGNLTNASINADHTVGIKNSYLSLERTIFDFFQIEYEHNGFEWDEKQQNLILGAFFWTHWITQLFAGNIIKKLGAKYVYGMTNLMGSIVLAVMPIAAYLNLNSLLLLRAIQGLVMGPCWPSMHELASRWIPPNERSKFLSSYMGTSIGLVILFPTFGYIMEWFCWEWIFYITLALSVIWFCAWQYLIYDTPAQHPRINLAERYYIEESLGDELEHQSQKLTTPWRKILTSYTIWVTILAYVGCFWIMMTLLAQGPTYFKIVHNWDMGSMGLLTGLPHSLRVFCGIGYSMFSDYLLTSGKFSKLIVRKGAAVITNCLAGCLLIGLAFSGKSRTIAPILYTLILVTNSAAPSGLLATIIDISPNFASTLLGIIGCIGLLPGFISPYLVGILTYEKDPIDGWCNVFLSTGIIGLISGIPFLLFADINTKSWNNTQRKGSQNKRKSQSVSFRKVATEDVTQDEI